MDDERAAHARQRTAAMTLRDGRPATRILLGVTGADDALDMLEDIDDPIHGWTKSPDGDCKYDLSKHIGRENAVLIGGFRTVGFRVWWDGIGSLYAERQDEEP